MQLFTAERNVILMANTKLEKAAEMCLVLVSCCERNVFFL